MGSCSAPHLAEERHVMGMSNLTGVAERPEESRTEDAEFPGQPQEHLDPTMTDPHYRDIESSLW